MQIIIFQTISDKIFLQFTVFLWNFDSPQSKGNFISSVKNFVFQLLNDLSLEKLKKLENRKKISKLGMPKG